MLFLLEVVRYYLVHKFSKVFILENKMILQKSVVYILIHHTSKAMHKLWFWRWNGSVHSKPQTLFIGLSFSLLQLVMLCFKFQDILLLIVA